MTFGQLMAFVREKFPGNEKRNGSILKQLLKRFGEYETEYMVRGAAKLGWKDLRGLWADGGVGRRWALQVYFDGQKRESMPQSIKDIFKGWGQWASQRRAAPRIH